MAFRLLFWRRPKPESAGRHVRATALPVPDSTGALAVPLPSVETVVERSTGELDAQERPTEQHDVDLDATAPVPVVVTPVSRDADEPPDDEASLEEPALVEPVPVESPLVEPAPVQPVPVQPFPVESDPVQAEPVALVPVVAGVALGFADGASVELHPDDPRVTSFRAAAAALLDPREA